MSDWELVLLYKSCNREAIVKLILKYQHELIGKSRYILKNTYDPENVLQEVILHFITRDIKAKKGYFTKKESVASFLSNSVTKKCFELLRKQKRIFKKEGTELKDHFVNPDKILDKYEFEELKIAINLLDEELKNFTNKVLEIGKKSTIKSELGLDEKKYKSLYGKMKFQLKKLVNLIRNSER